MTSISKSSILQPSSLIFLYIAGLSFTFLFVDDTGQSTLIDELLLLAMLPFALIGLYRNYFSLGWPAKLIIIYFVFAVLSSIATMISRDDIPFAAPVLGILLDTKFIILLGALLYFAQRSKKSNDEIVLDICKVIVFLGLVSSIFFLRDVFSGGTSLAGIRLRSSNIFGYVPIGLFPHKLYTAAISSAALASAITLYLISRKARFLWAATLFIVFLFLSSSMKELGIIVAIFLILFWALNNQKNKVSSGSKKVILIGFLLTPIFAAIFGDELDRLIASRVDVYLLEENVRAELHIKSAKIATDYFPFGSGAGTFSSQPSRNIHFSPFYYEYGMHYFYGATEENSSFLMDAGWPKFIAEAGWIGGGAYFMAFLISFVRLFLSFSASPNSMNLLGVMVGSIIFSSALGSAVFTGTIGLMLCAIFFLCYFLNYKNTRLVQK